MRKNGAVKLIVTFINGSVHYFVIAVISSMMMTLLDGFIPQIIRFAADSLIYGSDPKLPDFILQIIQRLGGITYLRSHFYIIAAAIIILAFVSGIFRFLNYSNMSAGSESFTANTRNLLFRKINRLPFSWHSANNTGDIIQRCSSDVETVRQFVSQQLFGVMRIVFIAFYAIFLMYSMNTVVATVAVACIPVAFTYSFLFHLKIHKKFKEADETEGVLSTVTQENLTGMRVVKAFGGEEYERKKFDKANEKYTTLWTEFGFIISIFWGTSDLVACLQMFFVIFACIIQSSLGNLTAGECIAFISYNIMLSWPIRSLGRIVSDMSKTGVAIERLNYIMDSETEDDSGLEDVDFSGDISFENVKFGYNEKDILKGVSFNIKGGSTFGITGGTGCGKSTLVQLLCRINYLAPDKGKIKIGGVDINEIKLSSLRKNVSIILQEPFLFSKTIGENIALSEDNVTEVDITASARAACIDETINKFSLGYNTIVGERGVTLSGGQKQRVAIARTLLKKSPVVIFDDSLSAVDTETDSKIRAELKKNKNGTTIIISHRITSLMGADMILVLDNGVVEEIGTHEKLLELNGRYRHIYDIQQSGAAEAANLSTQTNAQNGEEVKCTVG